MKLKMVFSILIYLLVCISTVSCAYNSKIQIIVDLIKTYERPTDVTAVLCWEPRMKINLMNQLGKQDRPSKVRFIQSNGKAQGKIIEHAPKDSLFVVDLTCPYIDVFINQDTKMFGSPYRWLILNEAPDGDIIPFQLEALDIFHDSEVIVALQRPDEYCEIYMIYKIRSEQRWITEFYGRWSSISGLEMKLDTAVSKILRRRNLHQEKLSVTFNVNDKEKGSRATDSDYKIRHSPHSVTRWGLLQVIPLYQFINASRVNYFTDGWGYFYNGSWDGLVGNMIRGEAEISGTPIFMAQDRLAFIDYLSNAVQTSLKFVFREPPLSYQNNLFLLPFNKAVWFSLGIFVMLMMVVIYVNALWETEKEKIIDGPEMTDKKMTLSDVAMMIVGAVSQQGSFIELKGPIGRLIMFILFLTFLFLFTAYSASIVALLQSSSKQIRTLTDLLNSRLELGVDNTSYNVHYFTTAKDPVRKAIYETKVAPKGTKPKFMSLEEGVRKLQKHPFAFNMDIGIGYRIVEKYFHEHEKCGLQEIAYIPISKPWLTCKKTSPYAQLFKIGLHRIREHGMSARANALVYSKKPVCSVKGGSFDSVSIVDVYPPLLMLLYGMLISCTLLAAEIFLHRHRQKKDRFDYADRLSETTQISEIQ